ncbi:MAG: hypothetical protein V7K24_28840 [Nostoc sp.]
MLSTILSISARIDSRESAAVGVLVVGLPSAVLIASNKNSLAVTIAGSLFYFA